MGSVGWLRAARLRRCARVMCGVGLVAGITACGSTTSSTQATGAATTSSAGEIPQLAALVPASIRRAGELRVATEVGYAPYEVYGPNGTTIEGLDVDLWHAAGKELGLKIVPMDGTYANIIPAIQAGRADVGWSAMLLGSFQGLTTAKFVVYENRSFNGLVVNANNTTIRSGQLPCGRILGWTQAESPAGTIGAALPRCQAEGKPIQILRFQKTPDILLAVESGKVDARIADSVNGHYYAKTSGGKLKFVPDVFPGHPIPTGIAVSVNDPQLITAIREALQRLVNNGTYGQIMNRWGAGDTTVKTITVVYRYNGG